MGIYSKSSVDRLIRGLPFLAVGVNIRAEEVVIGIVRIHPGSFAKPEPRFVYLVPHPQRQSDQISRPIVGRIEACSVPRGFFRRIFIARTEVTSRQDLQGIDPLWLRRQGLQRRGTGFFGPIEVEQRASTV